MPETFGGGVGWPPQRCFPTALSRIVVPAFNTTDVPISSDHGQFVLTCMEIVTDAGFPGNAEVTINHLSDVHPLWPVNIGSSVDVFSWRGMMPFVPNDRLDITNGTGGNLYWLGTGFWVMDSAFIT